MGAPRASSTPPCDATELTCVCRLAVPKGPIFSGESSTAISVASALLAFLPDRRCQSLFSFPSQQGLMTEGGQAGRGICRVITPSCQTGSTAHLCPQGTENAARPEGLFLIPKMQRLRTNSPGSGRTCQLSMGLEVSEEKGGCFLWCRPLQKP